jgi:hypothetical protein
MFANKIAGASVAFAIDWHPPNVSHIESGHTVLTEAVAVVGCTCDLRKISAYDFGDVSTMGLY